MTARTAADHADLPIIDMADPLFWADIHTPLDAALAQHPLARSPQGAVTALGYHEVETVLRDPRFLTTDLLQRNGLDSGPLHDWWSRVMFSTNPPQHTRLRSLVSRAFTPRRIQELSPTITRIADATLSPHVHRGELDLLHDYAHWLPIRVMGHLLDIPPDDFDTFATWTANLGLTFNSLVDAKLRVELEQNIVDLNSYVETLIETRRGNLGDDLLSALITAEEGGDRLSTTELVAMVENLLFAGHDTTRSFLSIALPLLLQHPDQLALLRAEPTLIGAAVEECLRFEPPVFGSAREPTTDVELAGITLPAGRAVSIATASANRDPRVFHDPQRFDINRYRSGATPRPAAVMSFGQGVHYCLGAALARAEGEIGIRRALELLPDLMLTEPLTWVPFASIRRYERVPVSFTPT